MSNVTAALLGLFPCVGWPAIWVAVAVYVMRYRSPVEWRGFFVAKGDEHDD